MKIACVNYEPVALYRDQGWSSRRLGNYYNPNDIAHEVCVFAHWDVDWQISTTVRVVGYHSFAELERKCREFRPDIIRCYEAFRPYCDYALVMALDLGIPSYLSLHDMRIRYNSRLAAFTAITAYTETLAKRAEQELNRNVEIQLNGIDSQLFQPRYPSSIDERVANATYRVFTVGRDDPVKNIGSAIEATRILAGRVGSIAHVLVGPGTENIRFDGIHLGLGRTSEEIIAEYLNWCNCFLQVQLVSDLGVAAAEALVVGRPIVTTGDCFGNAHNLIDDSRGVLVPIDKVTDPHYVADALHGCLLRQYDFDAIRHWAVEIYDAEDLRKKEAERYLRLTMATRNHPRESPNRKGHKALLLSMRYELRLREMQNRIATAVHPSTRHLAGGFKRMIRNMRRQRSGTQG